jgi:PhzF family phenazine biosynthesis protein
MTQGAVEFAPPLGERQLAELLEALGLDRDNLDPRCPPQIVSTGHSKVLVGLNTVADVDRLRPDLPALQSLSLASDCNGYFAFAFTRESSALTYGRMFAPAIGINEDPVTGNANGPLGVYLVEHHLVDVIDDRFEFTARQGDALGRPGSMRVAVTASHAHPTSVAVTGRAVIVFSTELIL